MRLKEQEIELIKKAFREVFGEGEVYLFGSRIDKSKRRGDIDLLIKSNAIGFKELIKIKTKLFLALGDRKVDIVFESDTPFVRHIKKRSSEIMREFFCEHLKQFEKSLFWLERSLGRVEEIEDPFINIVGKSR